MKDQRDGVFLTLWTMMIRSNMVGSFLTQEAQLSPSDRAMRLVSSNLANCHATVQKLLI